MKKLGLSVKVCLLLLFSLYLPWNLNVPTMAKTFDRPFILAKKSKKTMAKKVEVITSKKALENSLNKHFEKVDTKFSYKISKKVVKDLQAFDKLFWDKKSKNLTSLAVLKQVNYLDYDYIYTRNYISINLTLHYNLKNKELKQLVAEMKVLKSGSEIQTEKELREAFFLKYHNLDKTFALRISKPLAKKYKNKVENFLLSLEDDPRYNDLKYNLGITGNILNNSSTKVFQFSTEPYKSKEELKTIISNIKPILATRKEIYADFIAGAETLEEEYSVNIKNDVLGYDIKDGNKFWDELYTLPEFNDLSHHNDDGGYYTEKYNGYFKLIINNKYTIKKEELDQLKTFVKTWIAANIKPEMTEEEKVRAINDFMVKEYRYTYGDRGQLFGKGEGEEKLGKYSVYTCFALIDGKGGVCNAKANMFYRLAKEAGLEVLYVTGKVSTGLQTGLHAWNLVKVDGVWYHLDNTWNRGQYEGSSEYDYFNTRDYYLKSDNTMRKNHSWDATKYPAAPMDYQGYVPTASIGTSILNKAA